MTNDKSASYGKYFRIAGVNRQMLPVILVVAALMIFDLKVRFYSGMSDTVKVNAVSPNLILNRDVILQKSIHQSYLKKLDELDRKTPMVNDDTSGEPEARAVVSQESKGWQSNGFDYRLLAIFNGKNQFAVLDRKTMATGDREVVQVSRGDLIGSYEVIDLLPLGVTLTNNQGDTVSLVLFEPSVED
jgi:hypothetical protein